MLKVIISAFVVLFLQGAAAQVCLTTAAGCQKEFHCCPLSITGNCRPVCTSIYQYCPGATCQAGPYSIKCPTDTHCCQDKRGARCQPSGELCQYIIDDTA